MDAWLRGAAWGLVAGLIGGAAGLSVAFLLNATLRRRTPEFYERSKVWGEEHPWHLALITGVLVALTGYIMRDIMDSATGLHPLVIGLMFFVAFGIVGSWRRSKASRDNESSQQPVLPGK